MKPKQKAKTKKTCNGCIHKGVCPVWDYYNDKPYHDREYCRDRYYMTIDMFVDKLYDKMRGLKE